MKEESRTQREVFAVEGARNRKLYLSRLKDQGLPLMPLVSKRKAPTQVQIAQFGVGLRAGRTGNVSASDLAAEAIAMWNAAGRAIEIEKRLNVLVRGLYYYNERDWQAHARGLVDSFNDSIHALPGRDNAQRAQDYEQAAQKAGKALYMAWRDTVVSGELIKALFPGKNETERSRGEKCRKLVEFAKKVLHEEERCRKDQPWTAVMRDCLTLSVKCAWDPLGFWDEDPREFIVEKVKEVMDISDMCESAADYPLYPAVARWMVVMRDRQVAAGKSRTKC